MDGRTDRKDSQRDNWIGGRTLKSLRFCKDSLAQRAPINESRSYILKQSFPHRKMSSNFINNMDMDKRKRGKQKRVQKVSVTHSINLRAYFHERLPYFIMVVPINVISWILFKMILKFIFLLFAGI